MAQDFTHELLADIKAGNSNTTLNPLLEEVRVLLGSVEALAGVEPVDQIGKLFITPFWDTMEKKYHIATLSRIYQSVAKFLEKATEDDLDVFSFCVSSTK